MQVSFGFSKQVPPLSLKSNHIWFHKISLSCLGSQVSKVWWSLKDLNQFKFGINRLFRVGLRNLKNGHVSKMEVKHCTEFESHEAIACRVSGSNYSISVFSIFLHYSRPRFFTQKNRIFGFFGFSFLGPFLAKSRAFSGKNSSNDAVLHEISINENTSVIKIPN